MHQVRKVSRLSQFLLFILFLFLLEWFRKAFHQLLPPQTPSSPFLFFPKRKKSRKWKVEGERNNRKQVPTHSIILSAHSARQLEIGREKRYMKGKISRGIETNTITYCSHYYIHFLSFPSFFPLLPFIPFVVPPLPVKRKNEAQEPISRDTLEPIYSSRLSI